MEVLLHGLDGWDTFGCGGSNKCGVEAGEGCTLPFSQLQVNGIVKGQAVRLSKGKSCREVEFRIGLYGKPLQGFQTFSHTFCGDVTAALGHDQAVANFQVPKVRYKSLVLCKTGLCDLGS